MKNQNHINFKQNKPAFTLGGKDGLQLKKAAFTLAEVLIVLGIIGVIAAICVPPHKNKIESAEYKSGFRKIYSTLTNARTKIKADSGEDYPVECPINDSECLATVFKPYHKYLKEVSGLGTTGLPGCWNSTDISYPTEPHDCLVLNDGSIIDFDMEFPKIICTFRKESTKTYWCALINIDVNGAKKPNKWSKDRFRFVLYKDGIFPGEDGTENNILR